MKAKYLIGLLCAAALAGLITIAKAPAQGNSQHLPHSIIFIADTAVFHYASNGFVVQDGLQVQWVDADQYAPEIKKGDRLADTIAKCMDLGYSYEPLSVGKHLLKR